MGIRDWWRRHRLDEDDFEDEIRAHLALAAEERCEDGVDPREARYAALREFGNVTRMTEETRRVWTPRWLDALRDQAHDVRYAIRTLVKNPGFSLAVLAVLTLGIGLNAAVFTMLKSFALSPLAGVRHAGRIVTIHGETSAGRAVRMSYPDFQYFRQHDRAFQGIFGSTLATMNLGKGRDARQVWGELVTGNYFEILGISPQHGRVLAPQDEGAPGDNPVAVISDSLWRRTFGADPRIVGRTIQINGSALTVVGVADASFKGSTVVYDVEVFIPVTSGPSLGYYFGSDHRAPAAVFADRRARVFYPQGYLRDGVSRDAAQAQADAIWASLSRDHSLTDTPERLRVVRFADTPGGAPLVVNPTLGVLNAMGMLVLAIACANIAGLVLVRGVSRRGEIAVRLALGASRARVVRLLVIENLVLAVPGVALGVLLAYRLLPILVTYAENLAAPQLIYFNLDLDGYVVVYSVLAALGSALVFGFIPALRSSRVDLVSAINEDASPRGAARGRVRAGLVVAQIAVSLLLLVGAGLAGRSLEAARKSDPGFDPSQVAAVSLDVKQNGYDDDRGKRFYRNLLDLSSRHAGVESAALAAYHPLTMSETRSQRVTIDGYAAQRGDDLMFLNNTVSPGYFTTLRIPIVAGRDFTERDDETAAPVVVVNRTLAQRFLGGEQAAIGRRLQVGDGAMRTVVGVAADIKYVRVNEAPRPYFYLPFRQAYRSQMQLHTRGPGSMEALVSQARADVETIDPEMPVMSARPLVNQIRGALIFFDLAATMLLAFGAAGMALAATGIYGLIAYTVKQRTREIGIRVALGASGPSIVTSFIAAGFKLGAAGAALGIAGAVAINPLFDGVLFGVSSTDGLSFIRALAVVFAGVLLATVVPAWRAARISPLRALRHQ